MDVIQRWAEKKPVQTICSILESPLFLLVTGGLAALCYFLDVTLLTLVLFAAIGSFLFFFGRDSRGVIPLLLFAMVTLKYRTQPELYTGKLAILSYSTLGVLLAASIVYRMVFRRSKVENTAGLWGIVLLSLAFFTGGVGSTLYEKAFALNLSSGVTIGATLLGGYALFTLTMEKREDNLVYFAKVCTVAICLIVAQVGDNAWNAYKAGIKLDGNWRNHMHFSWAWNNMGIEMVPFLFPAVFYLIYKEKYGYFYCLLVPVIVVGVYFQFCRNAILWTAITLVFGCIATCVFSPNRKKNLWGALVAALLLVGFAFTLYQLGQWENVTEFLKGRGLDDSGRFEVWRAHWQFFTSSPVFGVGFGTNEMYTPVLAKAHNIVLQMLGSSGVLGFGCFLFHGGHTAYDTLAKSTPDKRLMSACVWVGMGLGLLSSVFFHAYFLLYYAVLLSVLHKA